MAVAVKLCRKAGDFLFGQGAQGPDFAEDHAAVAHGFDDVAGSGLALGTDHGSALGDAAQGFPEVAGSAYERHGVDAEFTSSDHERLKACLSNIKGRFVLSYNDDDFIRNLYKDFKITEVERQNNLSRGSYKELIITNY